MSLKESTMERMLNYRLSGSVTDYVPLEPCLKEDLILYAEFLEQTIKKMRNKRDQDGWNDKNAIDAQA